MEKPKKKLKTDIFATRVDGNAHALCSKFRLFAQKEGWTRKEIDEVLDEGKSGDYDHLIQTIMCHTE